ncbi:MAG: ABC transporter ATP-binding protein [Clostridia bacterium]|jgi:zinc transport system ATP-binding protein|nr:ABC transporter ATP-binding protein [Clostridia bacterium]MCI1959657.1 ABC transporter ATP-binding protein [Clostridia bacterium]MCI2000516.1 ABC transporter ATP-binding protein [Clostridia bacterium]MCI2014971.1 ABC transporter ATP-binding protein [Clostridia bacterium]
MSETAVHIENLSVNYGRTSALTDVCLDVSDGEYLGIIGPNGGGKSTLLKTILGLVSPSSGIVEIYGKKPGSGKALVGYVPQFSSVDKKFPITLFEVVLTGHLKRGLSPFFRFSSKNKISAYKLLERVGIADLADRQISELSGGEFQKMLIARALAVNPKLLLLDEPTASVDAVSREQIYSLLSELNKSMTIILVTHDLFAVSSQVHRIACLNGHLVYHGEPELTENIVNSLYGCPVDLIAHGVPHRVLRKHEEGKDND